MISFHIIFQDLRTENMIDVSANIGRIEPFHFTRRFWVVAELLSSSYGRIL